jgi:anaerobic selenocysteine-containing dehydrogenase
MLLKGRIPEPKVWVNPESAARFNLSAGSRVTFALDGSPVEATLAIKDDVPQGVVLVPRSVGLPIEAPVVVELKAVG